LSVRFFDWRDTRTISKSRLNVATPNPNKAKLANFSVRPTFLLHEITQDVRK